MPNTTKQSGSCCGGPTATPTTASGKPLTVEFLYLDLTTCGRCRATDSSLKEALSTLSGVFDMLGFAVHVDEVEIASRDLAVRYRFVSSPTIRVNGVDIEQAVKESDCADCGSLSGCSTDCRVFTYDGNDYEQPPAAMIVDGILRVLFGGRTPDETPYVLPDNLDRFFSGAETSQTDVDLSKGTQTTSIHVYEPALCCNPGVCGPNAADAGRVPSVLFVCVHNAGRSQMAAGFLRALAGDRVEVRSAGSTPADKINPIAVQAMAEVGIDITGQHPRILAPTDVERSDVVVTMGCGDACPFYPGVSYEEWELDDPAGQDIETVRRIRDDIRARVQQLIHELPS